MWGAFDAAVLDVEIAHTVADLGEVVQILQTHDNLSNPSIIYPPYR